MLTPNASSILAELVDMQSEQLQYLQILDPNTVLTSSSFLRYINQRRFFSNFHQYLIRASTYHAGSSTNILMRAKRLLCRKTLNFVKTHIFPSFRLSAHSPRVFAEDIQLLKKLSEPQPKIILNMYLDLYSNKPGDWRIFHEKLSFLWSYIHIDINHTLKNIQSSSLRGLRGIFYINEDFVIPSAQSNRQVDYCWIPDVATTLRPKDSTPLALKVKELARGRKIAFLGGAIGGTKNLSAWYEVISLLDPQKWFFVQCGAVDRATLTKNDLLFLQEIESHPPENLLIYDQFLKNDSDFNELVVVSDLIWGLYRNFDRSSNILGKSAMFHKPILVSDKFLMGERVKKYGIGIALDEDNTHAIARAMNDLISYPIEPSYFYRYSAEHGPVALADKLDLLLTRFC